MPVRSRLFHTAWRVGSDNDDLGIGPAVMSSDLASVIDKLTNGKRDFESSNLEAIPRYDERIRELRRIGERTLLEIDSESGQLPFPIFAEEHGRQHRNRPLTRERRELEHPSIP